MNIKLLNVPSFVLLKLNPDNTIVSSTRNTNDTY